MTTRGPVAVLSDDPSLAMMLRASRGGSSAVIQLTQGLEGVEWAWTRVDTVVVDVPPERQRTTCEEVRRRHAGRLVLVVDDDEPADLPADTGRLTLTRPFAVADLVRLLSSQPPGPADGPDAPRPAAGRRFLRWPPGARVLAVVPAALALLVAFFVGGMLSAAWQLRTAAQATRTELGRIDGALGAGRPDEARRALETARQQLSGTDAALGRRSVRLAARLPVLSAAVVDLRRLVTAAHGGTRAADHAIALYEQVQDEEPATALYHRGRFNLDAIFRMRSRSDSMLRELASARRELAQVRGGPLEPGVARARTSGLRQLDQLTSRAARVLPALNLVPSALGAERPRTYIVVLTTPVELRPAGGTPLAAVRVRAEGGRITLQSSDASVSLHHAAVRWRAAPGDPWADKGEFGNFSMANSSPHFPTSGRELIRAYQALTGVRPDGVISIDPLAMRALLRATGPLTLPAYGKITAGKVAQLTMKDAFDRWPDSTVRRRYNQELVNAILRRFLDGRQLLEKLRALGSEGAERHLQVYMADPPIQRLAVDACLDGSLSPTGRDYLAVYTKNTNASRVDYFQRRAIDQRVELRQDGSASVTRTIQVENRAPSSGGFDSDKRTGYSSPHSSAVLATYLPSGASLQDVSVDGRPLTASTTQEAGRPLLRTGITLRPSQKVTVRIRYQVPAAAERTDSGLVYELAADPQPMATPPILQVEVVAPEGFGVEPGHGWSAQDRSARLSVRFTESVRSRLQLPSTSR